MTVGRTSPTSAPPAERTAGGSGLSLFGRRALTGVWIVLLLGAVYGSQRAIEHSRERDFKDESLYLPNGQMLSIVSLGYDNVVADFLWLYSIQYAMEEFWGGKEYEWLAHIFDLITDLDPQFENAYVMGAMFLGMVQSEPELAIALLEKGTRSDPENWVYWAEMSFYSVLRLKDRTRAMEYLERAIELPDAPPRLKTRLAAYYRVAGKWELELGQWIHLYGGTNSEPMRELAAEKMRELVERLSKKNPRRAREALRRVRAAFPTETELIQSLEKVRREAKPKKKATPVPAEP